MSTFQSALVLGHARAPPYPSFLSLRSLSLQVPYIDWAAHIFGLISGGVLGLWIFGGRCDAPLKRALVRGVGLGGYLLMMAAGLAVIFTSLNPPTELLHFCTEELLPSYPNQGLQCYSP